MYSLEDGFKYILAMADEPFETLDLPLLQAKIMEFAAVLDKAEYIPSAIIEAMPMDMRKACISVAVGVLTVAIQERMAK